MKGRACSETCTLWVGVGRGALWGGGELRWRGHEVGAPLLDRIVSMETALASDAIASSMCGFRDTPSSSALTSYMHVETDSVVQWEEATRPAQRAHGPAGETRGRQGKLSGRQKGSMTQQQGGMGAQLSAKGEHDATRRNLSSVGSEWREAHRVHRDCPAASKDVVWTLATFGGGPVPALVHEESPLHVSVLLHARPDARSRRHR